MTGVFYTCFTCNNYFFKRNTVKNIPDQRTSMKLKLKTKIITVTFFMLFYMPRGFFLCKRVDLKYIFEYNILAIK